jgi:hypothetical protein
MRLQEVSRTWQDGQVRLTGVITRDGSEEPFHLYFAYPEEYSDYVAERADPFAAAMLVPAMFWNEPLEIPQPISPRLAWFLPEIRIAMASWRTNLSLPPLNLNAGVPWPPAAAPQAACFFSGGVDSFHSALRRHDQEPLRDPLTHLLYMRGVETPLPEAQGLAESQQHVEAVARSLGLGCIVGETNLRTFFTRHYERYYSGSCLASTALSLGGGFSTVCIPASSTYATPLWSASNHLTDPMFSTESLQLWHDGADTVRSDKVRHILQWNAPLVRQHLRVCIQNNGGAWNCGSCYKCVRTAIVLELLGELGPGAYFRTSPTSTWRRTLPQDHAYFTREALALARELGTRPDLVRMLQRIVNRRARTDAALQFVRHSPFARAEAAIKWVRDRLGIPQRER